MRGRTAFACAAALAVALPVSAVGLGPLSKEGLTDGPEKGFYLTLLNPEPEASDYSAQAIGYGDEAPVARVAVLPSLARLGANRSMRLLVIARDLVPGETFRFRVCAERVQPPTGVYVNARVCSKLTAHRVPDPGAGGGNAGIG